MGDLQTAFASLMARLFPPPPILRTGSKGPDVVKLQAMLNSDGADLKVDGIFGPKTRAAVQAYQKSNGLVTDSIVGPQTWGSLKR